MKGSKDWELIWIIQFRGFGQYMIPFSFVSNLSNLFLLDNFHKKLLVSDLGVITSCVWMKTSVVMEPISSVSSQNFQALKYQIRLLEKKERFVPEGWILDRGRRNAKNFEEISTERRPRQKNRRRSGVQLPRNSFGKFKKYNNYI